MLLADIVRPPPRWPPPARARRRSPRWPSCCAPPGRTSSAPVVAFLTGQLVQGRIGAGWRTLGRAGRHPGGADADDRARWTGAHRGRRDLRAGSAKRRSEAAARLFARATEAEQQFLFRLLTGELRQGALEGVMVDAVAAAAEVPVGGGRRASCCPGSLPATAMAAMTGGEAALGEFRLELGRPIRPMLASPAESMAEAFAEHDSSALVEYKMDGARIQVHRENDEVHVYTRTLREITGTVTELVELVRALPVRIGGARRRDAGAHRRRQAPPVPGDDEPVRQHAATSRSARCCCGRISSTACTSTARPARRPAARAQRGPAQGGRRAR